MKLAPTKAVIIAIRKILRGLVRFALNFRMAYPQMAELLKSVYVEVAEDEFSLPKKVQTDSRLSLLTGIYRKDIKRIREQRKDDDEMPFSVNVGGKLVSRWTSVKEYQDEQGNPRQLPLKSTSGVSFAKLVKDICKQDIRPNVILDEWLDLGVISLVNKDFVKLNQQAFIPSKGNDEKVFFLGHNLSDHLSAATHNVIGEQPPFFERCVYYDGLSEESVAELKALIEEKGMETLLAVNDVAMKLKTQDIARPSPEKHRLDIGLYMFHEGEQKKSDQGIKG
ncbi:MAG: Unknown protein [uncultured Thiotrichaceae bacterium]|uniref:Uncharacterized protein n=1 Tax=uncultured Thiotrichaceae bacterium TaxID=298394 RepID=A0A6S6TMN6_9GAMM|nr:MAG: Unknown protein [uncultured Thiotrichaceae bacterium]